MILLIVFFKQTEFNTEPDHLPCTSKPMTEDASQTAVMLPPVLKPLFSQSQVSSENTTSTVKCIILLLSPCELPVVPSNYTPVNNYTKEENFENMSASNTWPPDSSAIQSTKNIMNLALKTIVIYIQHIFALVIKLYQIV